MQEHAEFASLRGETLTAITGCTPGSDVIEFTTASGRRFRMYHRQDCCESVAVEDVAGDVADLIGEPILLAEETSGQEDPPGYTYPGDYRDSSWTWTFYKLATNRGYATIRWYGTSNGYYSEAVDFARIA